MLEKEFLNFYDEEKRPKEVRNGDREEMVRLVYDCKIEKEIEGEVFCLRIPIRRSM